MIDRTGISDRSYTRHVREGSSEAGQPMANEKNVSMVREDRENPLSLVISAVIDVKIGWHG